MMRALKKINNKGRRNEFYVNLDNEINIHAHFFIPRFSPFHVSLLLSFLLMKHEFIDQSKNISTLILKFTPININMIYLFLFYMTVPWELKPVLLILLRLENIDPPFTKKLFFLLLIHPNCCMYFLSISLSPSKSKVSKH